MKIFRSFCAARRLRLLVAGITFLCLAGTLPAQTAADPRIAAFLHGLSGMRNPRQAAISPDGKTVAWVAPDGDAGQRIFLRALDGAPGSEQILPAPGAGVGCAEGDVVWSPKGHRIAFTSDCMTHGQQQIFVTQLGADEKPQAPRQITAVKGFVHRLAWSPDGKQLGFLFIANATRPPNAVFAIKPLVGVISANTIAEVQRLALVDPSTAAPVSDPPQISPTTLHVYEFAWSPDSHSVAYIAAPPPGDDNWWVAQLYTQQAAPSAAPQSILKPTMQIAVPRWSPDGKQIAFIGGLMSDRTQNGGDIYLIPADGGTPRNLTPGRKATPAWIHWFSDSRMGFTEVKDGMSRYSELNPKTSEENTAVRVTFPATIGAGYDQLDISFSRQRKPQAALIKSTFDQAPEVWAGNLQHLTQITHLNDSLKPTWGKSESVTWTNEGYRIQGWLVYPRNYDPHKKYALILYVHGGPSNRVLPRWPYPGYNPLAFSAVDDFVLMPNPRGSFGEGETFTEANRKDFGYGDLRDLLAGVDTVTKRFPVDNNRVGITGWSYGGFMTMFAITQTHRFRAAVAGAGISDWKSYYGENSIDTWMIPFFGASVYDDPSVYAKSSAINFIKNAKTPTLIVVGERDGECPAPQSFEMWHALRAMHVPVKLVVYPGEGHGFTRRADSQNVLERAVAWFNQYMPAAGAQ